MKDADDKEVDEEVEIDAEKQTETVSIPNTDSGNAGEVKVVFDFKKVINLIVNCMQLQLQLFFLLNTCTNILQHMADSQVALANLGGSACVKIYKQKQNVQQTRKEEFM